MCVGSLRLIFGTESTSRGMSPDRETPPHHPPENIDDVNPIVAHFSIPEVPEPVPVVMDQVLVVGLIGSGSQPEIPVEPVWAVRTA